MSGPLKAFHTGLLSGLASVLLACSPILDLNQDTTSATAVTSETSSTQREVDSQNTAINTPETEGIQHFVDISGCWRPVIGNDGASSDGASFTIFTIASNTFVIGDLARTSLVVDSKLNFIEGNRDPKKPFFPPGYVHSTGTIDAEGRKITRSVLGQNGSRSYRRCADVFQSAPDARQPVVAPGPSATPEPEATAIVPLIDRLKQQPATPSPSPSAEPAPTTQPPSPTP